MAPTDQGAKMLSFGTLRGVKLWHHMAPMHYLKWHLYRQPRTVREGVLKIFEER